MKITLTGVSEHVGQAVLGVINSWARLLHSKGPIEC
jgi:hypothetical protein